jgi:hypothetical protein
MILLHTILVEQPSSSELLFSNVLFGVSTALAIYLVVALWVLACAVMIPGSAKEAFDVSFKWPIHVYRGIRKLITE